MLFKQLNTNKAKSACDNLCRTLLKTKTECIYMLQEMYFLKNGRIPGLPRNYIFYGNKHSRAIIIAPRNVNLWYCPEFSGKDITTCLFLKAQRYTM